MKLNDALQRTRKVINNLPYLPGVLSPLDRNAFWSECNPENYESLHHFASAMRGLVLPIYAPFREVPHLPYEVPEQGQFVDDDQAWFFLNGICTSREVLRLNGKALANLLQRKIYLMHNPSDGIVLDLLECAVGRTMQPVSKLDESVAHILEDALDRHRHVVLMAHSQGGIITTAALGLLAKKLTGSRSRLLKKLSVFTFASAATEFDFPEVYAEHFFHTRDYVARIGVAGYQNRFTGRLFEYDAVGHLLNTHYLKNLVENRFVSRDGRPSRLVEQLRIQSPAEVAPKKPRKTGIA